MEKKNSRLLVGHVHMDCHDVDFGKTESFQRGLQFVFRYREIAIDHRVIVAAGKRRPRVHAHLLVDLDAMHLRRPPNRKSHHPVLRFALHAEDFVERRGRNRTLFG